MVFNATTNFLKIIKIHKKKPALQLGPGPGPSTPRYEVDTGGPEINILEDMQ